MDQRVVFYLRKVLCFFSLLTLFFSFATFSFFSSNLYSEELLEVSAGEVINDSKLCKTRLPSLKDIITDFFGKGKKVTQEDRLIMVYPGGFPLGFTMECRGVVVIALGEVLTSEGMENLLKDKNIKVGDIVASIN